MDCGYFKNPSTIITERAKEKEIKGKRERGTERVGEGEEEGETERERLREIHIQLGLSTLIL